MRRRITTMLIGGERMAVVKYKPFLSERFAVLATSENPDHAQSSIRKTLAYQRRNITLNVDASSAFAFSTR